MRHAIPRRRPPADHRGARRRPRPAGRRLRGRDRRPGARRRHPPVPRQARDRVLHRERRHPASAAVDGNTGTRWSSAFSDPQWLQVDLGATATITSVALNWEAAYAKSFQIQTSPNGHTWTNIYSTTTGAGGVQNLTVSGSGRYVRVYGTARATAYGYSLWEFQVFGSTGSSPAAAPPTPPKATRRPPRRPRTRAPRPRAAVDGDAGTRWSSAFADPQWLQVDLGSSQPSAAC